jgi:hypothetical protein
MPALRFGRAARAMIVAFAATTACAPAASTPPTPTPTTEVAGTTTLLTRLGSDTLGVEQYTRTATRMEGVLVQRSPFTTVARYQIELGPNSRPTHAEYSARRGNGDVLSPMQSLSVQFAGDTIYIVGHRASGDTAKANIARGPFVPYVNGSYGLMELALSRVRSSGRDSMELALVPLNFAVRNTTPMPLKLTGADMARVAWFGAPLYLRHDGRGNLLSVDGSQTTNKVRVDRVAAIDMDTLARTWAARDQTGGPAGPVSTRDTVRATIGRANVWVDYGRPALRGRNVWVNGVLGDTIWRTGANAATQLRTDADLSIGGATVPAGLYTLWTQTTPSGYRLIVNREAGQWGTEYHPERDLVRIQLRESPAPAPAERFTIAIDPQGTASAAVLTLTWGDKQLSVPVTAR